MNLRAYAVGSLIVAIILIAVALTMCPGCTRLGFSPAAFWSGGMYYFGLTAGIFLCVVTTPGI